MFRDKERKPRREIVTSVKIHSHVGEVELCNGVICAFEIGVLRVGALRHVQVCNQVSETVGLYGSNQQCLSL
jgi:hypothetical protein